MLNFKKIFNEKISNDLLNSLSKDDRIELLELVGRGTLDYLKQNTEYDIYYSKPRFYPVDGIVATYNNCEREYKAVIEIKSFYNIDNYRSSEKYFNYQIDAKKLGDIVTEARKHNCRPILICLFSDELVVWDLDKTDWVNTTREVETNDKGTEYGKSKSKSLQAYLKLSDAIYRDSSINIDFYYEEIHKFIFGPKTPKPLTEEDNLPF